MQKGTQLSSSLLFIVVVVRRESLGTRPLYQVQKLSVQVIFRGVVAGNVKRKEGLTYTSLNLRMCWKDVLTLARKSAPDARQSSGPERALGQREHWASQT